MMELTPVFYKTLEASRTKRIIINYGGSSSSKTITVLQLLTLKALKYPGRRITLVAESIPVIRKTILADWKDIIMKENWDDSAFNKSELVYTFPNGSRFMFVNGDDPSRFHGPRQDDLMIDEVFNVPKSVYDQAEVRTSGNIYLTFNPTAEFWVKDMFDWSNVAVIHSTYDDNPFVPDAIKETLERRLITDPNFYRVYRLGEWGSLEGLIFEEGVNWSSTSAFPTEYSKRVIAGDFGFSVDPTAIIDLRYSDGELWAHELVYQTNMLNSDISSCVKPLAHRTVFDSAEPKSIAELRKGGIDVHPAQKGPDSIANGIKLVKEFKLNITKDSINLIKEMRRYRYAETKQGEILPKPVDKFNHAVDALRYGCFDLFNRKNIFFK